MIIRHHIQTCCKESKDLRYIQNEKLALEIFKSVKVLNPEYMSSLALSSPFPSYLTRVTPLTNMV